MNHSDPTIARITSCENSSPSQKSSPSSKPETTNLISSLPSTSRKRPRQPMDESQSDNGDMASATKESTSNDDGETSKDEELVVKGLRLEAIFHPKFDNERNKKQPGKKGTTADKKTDGSGEIRNTMLQKLGYGDGCSKVANDPKFSNNDGCKGTGHLEVSLKHSGSLVLWSGSTRYYSKNSACNQFTRTAEILLRQRFETVRTAMVSSNEIVHNNNQQCYLSYEDCSRFVSSHRYTIAFEVVTAEMLGDHGQIPNHDYVVVTAVADRNHERFLSTTQVLEFCHKFRLPHNDVWTFFPPVATANATKEGTSMPSSAEMLFQMYDNSLREKGYTENTVQALTDIADVYVPSPIPHTVFQGSICEGFIVRYVDGPTEEREQLEGLAKTARSILKEIPPPCPSSARAPVDYSSDSVLNADLRALYQSTYIDVDKNATSELQEKQTRTAIALQRQRARLFSGCLEKVLFDGNDNESDGIIESNGSENERQIKRRCRRRQRHDLKKIDSEKNQQGHGEQGDKSASTRNMKTKSTSRSFTNYDLPTLTKDLIDSRDKETKRIASLLQTLDGLKGGRVTYTWMEKYDDGDDNTSSANGKTRRQLNSRLYCIIHVHNDSTFFKYQKLQNSSDMNLFRGFCVEVLTSPPSIENEETINQAQVDKGEQRIGKSLTDGEMELNSGPRSFSTSAKTSGAPLMLKMKLLPYMVRTFICRNLLETIYEKGPEEFERIASGLLEKWKMSSNAQEHWIPFCRGWALYALQCKVEQERKELQRQKQGTSDSQENENLSGVSNHKVADALIDDKILELGPLTNFSYLRHLENFTKLYGNGKFRTATSTLALDSPECQTFVCVVSQSTEVSLALANYFSDHLNKNGSNKGEETSSAEGKMFVCSIGEAAKNRRSKSCVAYGNVANLTKGIKKFICDKKVAKQSILILFGSNKDEIIAQTKSAAEKASDRLKSPSWLDISSEGEGKKLTNMWKPWKKFPCVKRIELDYSAVELEPKRENSTAAVLSNVNGTQGTLDTILEVGRSLIEQEIRKKSDPNRGGILAFFPGIPGCGKSTLIETAGPKLKEEIVSRKAKKNDFYNIDLHCIEGDKIGKKFWNIIEDHLSDDKCLDGKCPALVIADKNAPPASWSKLGQIGRESNSILIPVLPDSSVLETTTIEGSIHPNGTLLPHVSHFYPFSLKYLAVSLYRVLSRPPGDHAGKLDSGFPMACMVVIQFFSFYRYIGADTFGEKMNDKFDKDGAYSIKISEPIKLPFLKASARDQALPDDLKELLEEGLKLRHGHDKHKQFKVKKDDTQLIDMEERIRSSILKHKDTIKSMTVNLEDSKEAFVSQVIGGIKSLSERSENNKCGPSILDSTQEGDVTKNVKLVSLDIDKAKVHNLLRKYQDSGALRKFFNFINSLSTPSPLPPDTENLPDIVMTDTTNDDIEGIKIDYSLLPDFVEKTHVTMGFAGETNSAETLISNFRHLQQREVEISVTGFLWSSTNAALAIKISPSVVGDDCISIPPCENCFPHVTVWCASGVKASLSNQLPTLLESGKAYRVDFDNKDVLVGKISFWDHNNEPFKI